jgi:hypothetical protein
MFNKNEPLFYPYQLLKEYFDMCPKPRLPLQARLACFFLLGVIISRYNYNT